MSCLNCDGDLYASHEPSLQRSLRRCHRHGAKGVTKRSLPSQNMIDPSFTVLERLATRLLNLSGDREAR
jgi:hypothetical protein